MDVPEWVFDAVFYQIFPDRFANGDTANDPPNVQPWGTPPTSWGFQGGDLLGVLQHMDYLQDLGINAIYLNPVFQSSSNHRYNIGDYYSIDPKLGSRQDFRTLLDEAHRRGVRIVLDGVFNHCGRGFFAFNDVLENEAHSPYLDWFHIKRFPLNAYGPGNAENYTAWWKFKSLPKFNTDNPQVRRYLIAVARYWVEQGIDGWRLDVPNEIDDDPFWADLRTAVKSANPDTYLVGEIWDGDPRWVSPGHFDGLLNYPMREALLGYLVAGTLKPSDFAGRVEALFSSYARENGLAHYSPLGSHDTERIRTLCGQNAASLRLAYLFQFFYPGVPGIYYGDEVGLEGGKDPDSRRAFPWETAQWDQPLRAFVKRLIEVRRGVDALRRGDFLCLLAEDATGASAFARRFGTQAAILVLNASGNARAVRIPVKAASLTSGQEMKAAIGPADAVVVDDHLEIRLGAWDGALLHT